MTVNSAGSFVPPRWMDENAAVWAHVWTAATDDALEVVFGSFYGTTRDAHRCEVSKLADSELAEWRDILAAAKTGGRR